MKKRLVSYILLTSFIVSLIYAPTISSQASDRSFNQAYKEYSVAAEEYRRTHEDYVLARSQYLKFKTLTSKNNAKEVTLKMLESRDEVAKTYLISLKERIKETKGISKGTSEGLIFRIDEELTWFADHKDKLPSAGSLEDLVSDSEEASERYASVTPLIYESLTAISSGRVSHFRERLNNIFSGTRDKVNEIKEEERTDYKFSSRKIQIIDRWIFETENRIARSEEKQAEAETLKAGFGDERKQYASVYNNTLLLLGESQQYLKEASSFVKEIVREIMTAE